ncbi:type II toxin-antitoxin system HicA family toxin [Ramlibacter sp. AW1]|uniref:Type II toxin-antitoxin system HicA family toxin n=1 Tax=Ramlibacter aurantiacus TaxID=2801330 RepID=A0A937D039_9BURK|nr:type II toxin-antitoxin system HicA family toxin [Ramlibacter aurantiacus]MBL0419014.1 type II toxin-antitoxin system HicA family toxin [Ramlibacter aurantiacus]
MSKPEKILERISRRPAVADIRWAELKTALEWLGFRPISGSGSRMKFFHADKNVLISLHKPHPAPEIGKKTIDDIRDSLQQNGFI